MTNVIVLHIHFSPPPPPPSYFVDVISDHAGGNMEMSQLIPDLTFCGNDSRIDAMNKQVSNNQKFNVRMSWTFLPFQLKSYCTEFLW